MTTMVPEGKPGENLLEQQGLHLVGHAGQKEDGLVGMDKLVARHPCLEGEGLRPLRQPGQFLQGADR